MITVVGIGPGSTDYLTPIAQKAIEEAEIIVGGERVLSELSKGNKETFPIKNNLAEVVSFIKEKHIQKKIAVLASGDPGMYGILNYLSRSFGSDELEVIPGISSIQLACARLKISWHDAVITSVHGREIHTVIDLVKNNPKVIILTDYKSNSAEVAKVLIDAGIGDRKAYVCQNLSYDNEVVKELTVNELKNSNGYPGCVLVISDE